MITKQVNGRSFEKPARVTSVRPADKLSGRKNLRKPPNLRRGSVAVGKKMRLNYTRILWE
jgi:hypothetical protein